MTAAFFCRAALLTILGLSAACSVNLSSSGPVAERELVEYFRNPGSRLPFSPAVRVGDVVYLSGQIGATADGKIPDGIEAQARAAMDNLQASAKLAGVTMDDVFKCLVMLDDMSKWTQFNQVYVTYFKPERLPARSAFGADGLALGATLEVECMAVSAGRTGVR